MWQCINHCTFNPSSVHILKSHIVCAIICFVVVAGPLAMGSLLAFVSRHAVVMPHLWICPRLSSILFSFMWPLHCSIVHSAQHKKSRGTFCTKGDSLRYGGMPGGILCPRAICPGGGVGHSAWGKILPTRLRLRSTYVYV